MKTPSALNLWMLGCVANGRREFPGHIAGVAQGHLYRCHDELLLVVYSKGKRGQPKGKGSMDRRLRLTDFGFECLADAVVAGADYPIPDGEYTHHRDTSTIVRTDPAYYGGRAFRPWPGWHIQSAMANYAWVVRDADAATIPTVGSMTLGHMVAP